MPYGTVSADVIQSSVTGASLGAGNSSIMKNRIINGAMVIDQRNAGASVTPTITSYPWPYNIDRWDTVQTQASKFSIQQNAGSVTPPAGFTKYLGFTSLSAYSPISTDVFVLQQRVEGNNVADLGWGTANAKTVTLSFWVRSSLTGTFGGSINNENDNRWYAFSYTISAPNTWEQKSITIVGDTTGTWGTANGIGLNLNFSLGMGSASTGNANSWTGTTTIAPTGSTNFVSTNGATFYITGVQLEVGSSATGFEYRQYGQELALCQRYYQTITLFNGDNGVGQVSQTSTVRGAYFQFPVTFRAQPTYVLPATGQSAGQISYLNSSANYPASSGSIAISYYSPQTFSLTCTSGSGFTVGNASILYSNGATTISGSAEL